MVKNIIPKLGKHNVKMEEVSFSCIFFFLPLYFLILWYLFLFSVVSRRAGY